MRRTREQRRPFPSSFKPMVLGVSMTLILGFLGCGENAPQVLTFPGGLVEHFELDGKKGGTFTSGHATALLISVISPPTASLTAPRVGTRNPSHLQG